MRSDAMPAKKPSPAACCTPDAGACCPPRPQLADRPLLDYRQADRLAGLFKVLANDTRLRLLHALVRAGEMAVTDLAVAVGMKTQAVSNQLQRLNDWGIVASRREGTSIRYRIADRCAPPLLDLALCLMEDART
jgi:DNA-binding transcriptional ArsR family regulator